jgi:hypothetical protein
MVRNEPADFVIDRLIVFNSFAAITGRSDDQTTTSALDNLDSSRDLPDTRSVFLSLNNVPDFAFRRISKYAPVRFPCCTHITFEM